MNRYGTSLMKQWQQANPSYVESLPDPREHFAQLGLQVETEIQSMLPALEGADRQGETYLEKVGRLQAARAIAEETVLASYQPPSDSSEMDEPPDWDEMSHDEQESWIRQNTTGEQQQEMLQALEARKINRMIGLGATYDPEDQLEG